MMKRQTKVFFVTFLLMILTVTSTALTQLPAEPGRIDKSSFSFWQKFRAAVIRGDKAAVSGMSQFPILMPYGMATVKSRAQLIKRYRDVFHHETSAANCFATAQPLIEPSRPKEFTVGCKNSAGDEVIIYSFVQTKSGWKFRGLDNINE